MNKILLLALLAISSQSFAGKYEYECKKLTRGYGVDERSLEVKTSLISKKVKKIDSIKMSNFSEGILSKDFYTSNIEKALKKKVSAEELNYILTEDFLKVDLKGHDTFYYDKKFLTAEKSAFLIEYDGVSGWCMWDACRKASMRYYKCTLK